jgi:hypothetical protein
VRSAYEEEEVELKPPNGGIEFGVIQSLVEEKGHQKLVSRPIAKLTGAHQALFTPSYVAACSNREQLVMKVA